MKFFMRLWLLFVTLVLVAFNASSATSSPVTFVNNSGSVDFIYQNFRAEKQCNCYFSWNKISGSPEMSVSMYLVEDANNDNLVNEGDTLISGEMSFGGFWDPSQTIGSGNYIAVLTVGEFGDPWLPTKLSDLFVGVATTDSKAKENTGTFAITLGSSSSADAPIQFDPIARAPSLENLTFTPNPVLTGQPQVLSFDYTDATKCYAKPLYKSNKNTQEVVYFDGAKSSGTFTSDALVYAEVQQQNVTVTCINDSGLEAEVEADFTVLPSALAAPEQLTAGFVGPENKTGKDYLVSWQAVAHAARYELEVSLDDGATWQLEATTTELSKRYIDPERADYQYRVKACNQSVCSELSNIASISVQPTFLPVSSPELTLVNQSGRVNFVYQNFTLSQSCNCTFEWTQTIQSEALPISLYLVSDENNDNLVDSNDTLVSSGLSLTGLLDINFSLDAGNYIAVLTVGEFGDPWLKKKITDLLIGFGRTDSEVLTNSGTLDISLGPNATRVAPVTFEDTPVVHPQPAVAISNLKFTPNPVQVGQEQTFTFDYENATKCFAKPNYLGNENAQEQVFYQGDIASATYVSPVSIPLQAKQRGFTVTCINDAGEQELTITNVISEPSIVLATPSLAIEYINHSNDYLVSWEEIENAVNYKLEVSFDGGHSWSIQQVDSKREKTYLSPAPGEYIYRVSACADGVCSIPSVEQNIVIRIPLGQCALN